MRSRVTRRGSDAMKAWLLHRAGTIDDLVLADIEPPRCGPNEVRVRNQAIGLNPVDWKFIGWGHPLWRWPQVPGVDGAGEVEAIGEAVQGLRIGDRVAYHTDVTRHGSFAECTTIAARAAIPLPAGLSMAAAAALPCPGLTALQALDKVHLPPGSTVLVTGASGAVGGALLQLARPRGWQIHAVASGPQHARVHTLGASEVLDYTDPHWRDDARALTRDQPYRAAFDMVSGAHAASLAPLLGANGHLVCIQDRQERPPLPPFTTTLSLHEVGLNAMHGHGDDRQWAALVAAGRQLAEETAAGRFDAQLIEQATFADLPAALGKLKAGPNPGNRVVVL